MSRIFKILTFIFFCGVYFSTAHGAVIEQEKYKTHLRWLVATSKKQLEIKQNANIFTIKTLSKVTFDNLKKDMISFANNNEYIAKVDFNSKGLPYSPAIITVTLKDQSIELFSFYKNSDKKYIIDFWVNEDLVVKKEPKKVIKAKKKVATTKPKKIIKKAKTIAKKKVYVSTVPKNDGYRDFRYGSAFIWDYKPQIPSVKQDINIANKAPNFLYKIKDRDFKKNDKEAHMQLSINFYKESKWGLMTRSISLYEKKYGVDINKDINDFMKAVSLIKNKINPKISIEDSKKTGAYQAALNLLSSISDRTDNYSLNQSITRYLLQVSLDKNDYVNSLQIAKKLYVISSERFDKEMTVYSAKVILTSLAQLKQIDKIKEFLSNKAVLTILPKQIGFAYTSYLNLILGDEKKNIQEFESRQNSFIGKIQKELLFNIAESYFRYGSYEKALSLYDSYIKEYSFDNGASYARVRLALCYDILKKDRKKIVQLYKSAINKSVIPHARYEAKVRIVGFYLARAIDPTQEELESLVFLDKAADEETIQDKNIDRILWLTRMRTMIVKKEYNQALSYLTTLPLITMPLKIRKVYEADGAEIILGLIQQSYLKEDYSKAIKVWQVYKDQYEEKVAKSTYLRYIVTDSYLRLGLMKSFNDSMAKLSLSKNNLSRNFPRWIPQHKKIELKDYLIELKIGRLLSQKLWSQLDTYIEKNKSNSNINYNYYKGLVSYQKGLYNKAVRHFESVLIDQSLTNQLSPVQNNRMLSNYLESIYEISNSKKFRKHANALLADIRKKKEVFNNLIERAEYLIIESLNSTKSRSILKFKTADFLKEFKSSTFKHRVKYIQAMNFIFLKNEKEGKVILEDLLKEKDTPSYLKGLARSELTTLVLKNRKL
ncbi:MAG: hypothetical protein N4A33_07195 [Bacteriovoracaceae bacterium]|jgi:TPR repeat protein|nr:hypothetical protein [Bacteriovoracaceae bacterium]